MKKLSGFIAVAALIALHPAIAATSGEAVYKKACMNCHAAGLAGAPAFGDKAARAPRIKTGKPALYESALKGKNAMPAKGRKPLPARCRSQGRSRLHGVQSQISPGIIPIRHPNSGLQ